MLLLLEFNCEGNKKKHTKKTLHFALLRCSKEYVCNHRLCRITSAPPSKFTHFHMIINMYHKF